MSGQLRTSGVIVGLVIGVMACSSPTRPTVTVVGGQPESPGKGTTVS